MGSHIGDGSVAPDRASLFRQVGGGAYVRHDHDYLHDYVDHHRGADARQELTFNDRPAPETGCGEASLPIRIRVRGSVQELCMSSPLPVASVDRVDDIAPRAGARVRAHKFGGSCLADAGCLRHVASLLRDEQLSAMAGSAPVAQVVVASAMYKTTDRLIALVDAARRSSEDPSTSSGSSREQSRDDWKTRLVALREQHFAVATDIDPDDRSRVGAWLAVEFATLASQMAALAAGHGDPSRLLDRVQGLGEVWSSRLLQCALGGHAEGWAWLDAREVLIVDRGDLGVRVDWSRARTRLEQWRHTNPQPNVVATGFIASDVDGRATTLGRNGSDHSGRSSPCSSAPMRSTSGPTSTGSCPPIRGSCPTPSPCR